MRVKEEASYWDSVRSEKLIHDDKPTTKELADFISEHIKGKVVLELGTGTGRILHELAKKYPKKDFITLDISKNMLKRELKKRPKTKNIKAELTNGREIPFKFDFLYSVTTLQHIDDDGVLVYLKEMKRKLKPNAEILLQFVVGDEKIAFSWQRSFEEIQEMCKDFNLTDLGIKFFPNWRWIKLSEKNI